jgi:hypothetical protein
MISGHEVVRDRTPLVRAGRRSDGLSQHTFVELLGKQGVAVMHCPASELQDDLGHA